VNKNVEEILGKLKSGDLLNQISGMDETKELIEHLIHQAVQTLFECDSTSRYAMAEKIFAMGPVVVPELESRFHAGGDPEAMVHAALILLKRGSDAGVNLLIQSLNDQIGPCGLIAGSLAAAGIQGTSDAVTDVLIRWPMGKDIYAARTLIATLRPLGTSVPDEVLAKLEAADPHIRGIA
jgi:hypothetical protein